MTRKDQEKARVEPFIFKNFRGGAGNKAPYQKAPAKEGEVRTINIIHCVAKMTLNKCKGTSTNTERVFVRGDGVDIIHTSMEAFSTMGDVKVWIIPTKARGDKLKRRLWLRPINLLREYLNVVSQEMVVLKAVEHGYVRGKCGISDSIKCTSVVLHDYFKIWIEDEAPEQEKGEHKQEVQRSTEEEGFFYSGYMYYDPVYEEPSEKDQPQQDNNYLYPDIDSYKIGYESNLIN